jgi:uncharacterized membrane protein
VRIPRPLLVPFGGPRGRRAPRLGTGSALAQLFALAALPVVLAVLRQADCFGHGWNGERPIWRGCYSDLATSFQSADLHRGLAAYLAGDLPLDQPPLSGAVMATLAGLAPGGSLPEIQRWYLLGWAVLTVLLLGATAALVATTRGHRGDGLKVVLAPVVALTAFLSPDLLGVALTTGGLWAWSRRRPALAGALLGAGFMARSYPGIVLLVLVVWAWRAGREAELGRLGLGALGAVVVIALPFVGSVGTLTRGWKSWWSAAPGLGSPWYVPTLAAHPLSATTTSILAVLGWVVALAVAGSLILGATRPPPLGAVVLLAVAIVLLTGKSFPLQSSLWLVPLVALAGLRWRDYLLWAGVEALHFVALWLYVGGFPKPERGLPAAWYSLFLLARLVAVGYLAWRVWARYRAPVRPPKGI